MRITRVIGILTGLVAFVVIADAAANSANAPSKTVPAGVVVDLNAGDKVVAVVGRKEALVAWHNFVLASRKKLIVQLDSDYENAIEALLQLHAQRPETEITVLANRGLLDVQEIGIRLAKCGIQVHFRSEHAPQAKFPDTPPLKGFIGVRDGEVLWLCMGGPSGSVWANILEIPPLAEQYQKWMENITGVLPSMNSAKALYDLGGK